MFYTIKYLGLKVMMSLLVIFLAGQNTAFAGNADSMRKGVKGSVTCGGNYYTRNGGTEIQRSTFILRNVSDTGVINLDRVRVFSANGTVLFDSDVSGIPASYNSVITAVDAGLDPRQTADIRIQDLIPQQGQMNRPLQTVFDWSAADPVLTLDAVNVRTNNDIDPLSGKIGTQRGRHSSACRTTFLKRHW